MSSLALIIPMRFSETTKKLIADLRLTAIRYKNDYIHTSHFLLIYNRYRQGDNDFKVSISCQKEIIADIKGHSLTNKHPTGDIPLSKHLELIIMRSDFQRQITGDKQIQPRHIYLGLIADDTANKQCYLNFLKKNNIIPGFRQRLKIKILFSSLARKYKIVV